MTRSSTEKNDFPKIPGLPPESRNNLQSDGLPRFNLRTTIMFWFLAVSLVPVVLVSLVGYHNAVQNRIEDFSLRLAASAQFDQQILNTYFMDLQDGMTHHAWSPEIQAMLKSPENISSGHELSSPGGKLLNDFRIEACCHDILLINQDGGLVFSSSSENNRGINIFKSKLIDSGLKNTFKLVLDGAEATFTDFKNRSYHNGRSLAYHVEPVRGSGGETLGLLVMALGTDVFLQGQRDKSHVLQEASFYVVDEKLRLLAAPTPLSTNGNLAPFVKIPELSAWQKSLNPYGKIKPGDVLFHQVVEYSGISGNEVLGIIQELDVLGNQFALVSEVPRVGVLAGLKRMGISLLLVIILVGILVVLVGFQVAHRMVEPINQLGSVMQRVADGHEIWNLPKNGPREVRQLTQIFNWMIHKLMDAREVNDRQYTLKRCQFELNEKLRGENTPESLSETVLQYLGEYFGAQLGVFYLVETRDVFRMSARFGLNDDDREIPDVHMGRGLVGRVAAQRKIQVLRGLGEGRHEVETGLVKSVVKNLIVAPICFGDRVLAVLELGLMEDVGSEELEFLDMVSETVAASINSVRSRERVHRLLKETWSQTAILSRQQKDLQESNRRFELADRYKSEFLANMSHELRTPLNSLLIMSQVLAENPHNNLSREEVDSAMTINRAGSDLLLLINDILDLSRVEAGKLDIQFSQFDLKPLLLDMKDLFSPLAGKQGLDFRTIIGPEVPGVMVSDPLRLTQILKNILNNAFKFTESGSITFRVRVPSPGEVDGLDLQGQAPLLVFSVSDTGVGMNNTTEKQIFEAFNQGDGSIGRRYGGSGLGLSISKKLSEMLGGQIQVESVEGKGSTFSLYLHAEPTPELTLGTHSEKAPLEMKVSGNVGLSLEFESENELMDSIAAVQAPDNGQGMECDLQNRRVLICEDDMRTVFQISEVLDDLGADVTLAPSWTQGVAEGRKDHEYDFAIVSNRLADRPDSSSLAIWKDECGHPSYPLLALISAEDGPMCEGADLVGSRPLVRNEFLGLIEKALVREEAQL